MSLMLVVSARIRYGAGLIGESQLYQGWASVPEPMAPNTRPWDSGSGNQCEGLEWGAECGDDCADAVRESGGVGGRDNR
jgi:hypothetical protein